MMKKTYFLTALALLYLNCGFTKDEDVTFRSGDAVLSGSLFLPDGKGPFPAVIFIHGSGPEDRSSSKTRAKAFVRAGFAAFIYDKRGVGKSSGDPKSVERYSFALLTDDVVAAAQLLAGRPEIDKSKIGFCAASQGGWVAPLAATKFPARFMIIISGSVTTVGEDNIFERNARLMQEGFSEKDIEEATKMHTVDQQVTRDGSQFAHFQELWSTYATAPWFKRVYLSDKPTPVDHPYRQWYRSVMDFDPVIYLNQINIPVLWLYGDATLDRFCPVAKSIAILENLKSSDYTIRPFAGANHSLIKGSKDLAVDLDVFAWLNEKVIH